MVAVQEESYVILQTTMKEMVVLHVVHQSHQAAATVQAAVLGAAVLVIRVAAAVTR